MKNSIGVAADFRSNAIDGLCGLHPPHKVTVIGTEVLLRSGIVAAIETPDVHLLDSTPESHSAAGSSHENSNDFTRHRIIVSATGGAKTFYKASLDRESGLIEPERLTDLWQNISKLEEFEVETVSLEGALRRTGSDSSWLIFEQFGAAQILETIENLPNSIDVIITRAIIDSDAEGVTQDLAQSNVERVLQNQGFVLFSNAPTRRPKTIYAVFVRNWKKTYESEVRPLREDLQNLQQRLTEIEQEERPTNEALKSELDALKQDLSDAQSRYTVAKNNLSTLEEKYRVQAQAQLTNEQRLQEIQSHLKIALEQLESDGCGSDAETKKSDTKAAAQKKPAQKNA